MDGSVWQWLAVTFGGLWLAVISLWAKQHMADDRATAAKVDALERDKAGKDEIRELVAELKHQNEGASRERRRVYEKLEQLGKVQSELNGQLAYHIGLVEGQKRKDR